MRVDWESLKTMADSRYARLAVLFPILGWLLVVNDELAAVVAKLTGVQEIARPSWKIYSLHVGLSLFGLGVGLFYLFCPSPIKDHANHNAFSASESKTVTEDRLNAYAAEAGLPRPTFAPIALSTADDARYARDLWYHRNLTLLLEVFDRYYQYANTQKESLARYVVFVLFAAGGFFTLIPSLTVVLWSILRIGKVLVG